MQHKTKRQIFLRWNTEDKSVQSNLRSLGVLFDESMSLEAHSKHMIKTVFII